MISKQNIQLLPDIQKNFVFPEQVAAIVDSDLMFQV